MWISIRLNNEPGMWENLECVPVQVNAAGQWVFCDGAYGVYSYLTQNDSCDDDTSREDSLFGQWEKALLSHAQACCDSDDAVTFKFQSPTGGLDTYAIRAIDDPFRI